MTSFQTLQDESLIFNWDGDNLDPGDSVEMINLETSCPSSLNDDSSMMVGFPYKVALCSLTDGD